MIETKNNNWLVLLILIGFGLACSSGEEISEANKKVDNANVSGQNQKAKEAVANGEKKDTDKEIADLSKALDIFNGLTDKYGPGRAAGRRHD